MPNQNSISYRGSVIDREEENNETVELPVQQTNRIPYTFFSMSNLVKKMSEKDFGDEVRAVKVSGVNKDIIHVEFGVWSDTQINNFDMSVHDVVCCYYEEQQPYFTTQQIAQKLKGKKGKPSKTLIASVEYSLFKMRKAVIFLDHSEQFDAFKKAQEYDEGSEPKKRFDYENLLYIKSNVEVNMNNNITVGHRLLCIPPLLEYQKIYKQIATLDDSLTDTSGFLTHNEETIALKSSLIRRIESMKNMRKRKLKKHNTKDISLEKFYIQLRRDDLLECENKKRQRFFKKITDVLDAFVANGYIRSYKHSGNMKNGKIMIGGIYDKLSDRYY